MRSVTTTSLLALVLALGACGSDAAHEVKVHNATDVPIVVFESGVFPNEGSPIPRRLQPGETWLNSWRRPFGDEPPATVRAEDQSGTLIFCRRFTSAEIQAISGRIEIVRGDIRCGP